MKKLLFFWLSLFSLSTAFAVDASKLLPPEQAFIPTIISNDEGLNVHFQIADGYYLYRDKLEVLTNPELAWQTPVFSGGKEKEDEFFGKQVVFYHEMPVNYRYQTKPNSKYQLTLVYQGCADVGVCYPPVETTFDIDKNGIYHSENTPDNANSLNNGTADRFLAPKQQTTPVSAPAPTNNNARFKLSWDTLNANLLAFFLAGLGLSFTACMYPLIPIVSSIVVGDKNASKGRAFLLTLVYTQGLALTYTLVGVIAGLTGSLLTVWLQQPAVVLSMAALMVVLALSMFGVFNIQLPNSLQSYFQTQSNKLSGGKIAGVFGMGMLSALIVGPCVAPPLAAALGYIGQTGDATLGGLALYFLALGTGVPLIMIGTFGGHILPRAGGWMNGVKAAFGFILLAVAVYLATPFIPYALAVTLYSALLIVPALWLLKSLHHQSGKLKTISLILSAVLLLGGAWFGIQSVRGHSTTLHHFLTLHPSSSHQLDHPKFTSVSELQNAMQTALQQDPNTPVILDFYADWCVSCKEMEAYTLNQPHVQAAVPMARFFQIDVTANTPEHQALLKDFGLFGPPGVFVIQADGTRSEALLGFAKPDEFIAWYQKYAK